MGNVWHWLERLIYYWKIGFMAIGGLVLTAMTVLIFADVIGRYVFNRPIPAVYEFSEGILMVAVVFLGVAAADHVRVRVLSDRVKGTASLVLELVVLLGSMAFIATMSWQTWLMALTSLKTKEAAEAIIAFPLYPSRFVVATGLFLLLLVLAASFVKTIKLGKVQDEGQHSE